MRDGKAVIALTSGGKWVGFSYFEAYLAEISDGITIYIDLLESIFPYLAENPELDLLAYESQHH